jgi:hypothetical protein
LNEVKHIPCGTTSEAIIALGFGIDTQAGTTVVMEGTAAFQPRGPTGASSQVYPASAYLIF